MNNLQSLLIEIEKFLRWFVDSTPRQREEHQRDLGEAASALLDRLEYENDKREREDSDEDEDTRD